VELVREVADREPDGHAGSEREVRLAYPVAGAQSLEGALLCSRLSTTMKAAINVRKKPINQNAIKP
jgi:hypothetical protein